MEITTFGPFSASEQLQTALSGAGVRRSIPAGELIFSQGDPVRGTYVLHAGRIVLTLAGDETVAVHERFASPGSVLGLPATMTGNEYSLSARAVEPCEITFVERDRALEVLRGDPSICFEVVEILAQEVSNMRTHSAVAALATSDIPGTK